MNTIGNLFTLTSFGESHGPAIGGVVDGMPAGIPVDMEFIQQELDRRRPGQSSIVTPRKESDRVEFLSGVFEGKTTGTPIGFVVRNENQHSSCTTSIVPRMPTIPTNANMAAATIGAGAARRPARR